MNFYINISDTKIKQSAILIAPYFSMRKITVEARMKTGGNYNTH